MSKKIYLGLIFIAALSLVYFLAKDDSPPTTASSPDTIPQTRTAHAEAPQHHEAQHTADSSKASSKTHLAPSSTTMAANMPPAHHLPDTSQFHPQADYTYRSQTLADAIHGLEQLNTLHKRHANITEGDVMAVWKKVDAAIAEHTITPIEALKHKQWLATLIDSSHISERLETETNQLIHTLESDAKRNRHASASDPKYLAYKAEEARITKEILTKYPNNKAKAAAELGQILDKVRAEIYQ